MLVLVFAAVAGAFGWRTGFLRLCRVPLSPGRIAAIVGVSFLFPAWSEEVLFRVLPLPHRTEQAELGEKLLSAAISLLLFVLYHPARVWLNRRRKRVVFTDWRFLTLAGLLGLCCTGAYLTSNSVWPPTLIHWVCVAIWLLYLDGYSQMQRE